MLYSSSQLRPSLSKWSIIQGSHPAHFQSLSTTWLVNSQPKELGSMNLLGVNRLMGLSNSSSTNYNKRATTRSLQVQRKSSRGLTVQFVVKRSLTSQVTSLLVNLPWLLISHWTKRMATWLESKMSLGMRMDTKVGMRMMWLLMRMTKMRPHNLCGHISRYLHYLSTSTAYNCCLELPTVLGHSRYHSPSHPQFVMMICYVFWVGSSWHHPHSVLPCHSTAAIRFLHRFNSITWPSQYYTQISHIISEPSGIVCWLIHLLPP